VELSFWERQTFFREADALIVGSGIVGLNTARALREKHPDWRIVVVERGILPYGASTRNAGFACFGSVGELAEDLKVMSRDEVFSLVERRWRGLQRLRQILGDDAIGYEPLGGYEVFSPEELATYEECLQLMPELNEVLKEFTGSEVYSVADNQIDKFGLNSVKHLIFNRAEGQIDTGRMMDALLNYVRQQGVAVYNGITIRKWYEHQDSIEIITGEDFTLRAQRVIFCTNGFATQLLPQLMVEPGRAQVLITNPIENLRLKGCFHADHGYYYFRNVGDRVLLGGGRNLDFEAERTVEFGLTAIVQQKLEQMLREMILPGIDYQIEQRWSGIMGLGPVKTTIVEKLTDRIYCAVRMGGMGVAIGSLAGEECADIVM
jgi:glycine/D-amino acid oxidase-like deaminating enzyme